jgi:hypothetical protein
VNAFSISAAAASVADPPLHGLQASTVFTGRTSTSVDEHNDWPAQKVGSFD